MLSNLAASVPDLLRLLALPVFAWVAILDVRTRRVPSAVWIPLGALGAALLAWDGWVAYTADLHTWQSFLIPTAFSVGFVVPLAYLFWWFGGFGGADAKALLVLALLFPVTPSYAIGDWAFPLVGGDQLLPFSLAILGNGVLVGLAIPVALGLRNALAGRFTPIAPLGWPTAVDRIPHRHGKLLQTTDGYTLSGLDLDALRMYLRWRGATFAELRADPERLRDPETLPDEPNQPTDGAIDAGPPVADGGAVESVDAVESTERDEPDSSAEPTDGDPTNADPSDAEFDDPWGAAAFLDSIEGTAYGTAPADLRDGLDVLATENRVWYSPGTPFLVPLFLGLLVAIGYGDVLISLMS
ncbi:peptidase A24A prepilin type IV [Halovivax asiaticus JCM 14624]|uniref:Peptidase A24A prepilin type IV n=1 Tax=Halovivax asiaticus JCM 14624 TaxID=1227490 RepID=M0BJ35_9EURY|nr:prepilin peptidase [Halovivax asiaticus]ELZ10906.1 peptidase A24A prepilin type IV [Halovivax asiaticus JCM 14624]